MTASPSGSLVARRDERKQRARGRRPTGALRATALVAALALSGAPALADAAGSLAGQTIVVDPGHGGIDSGAVANGVQEKTVTLAIGLDLSRYLRGQGARVVLTRTADVTVGPGDQRAGLETRTALANRVGASAYVSVHANSLNDPSYRGVMTFYGRPSGYANAVRRSASLVSESRALAQDVQQGVIAQTGAVNRGVDAADYFVLGNAAMPSILIETGFLTNAAEARQLASPGYEQAAAAGIANGIAQFFSNPTAGPVEVPIQPAPLPAEAASYVVRSGDTLSGIAARIGVAAAGLARLNGIDDPNAIVVGRTLRLPGGDAAQAATGVPLVTAVATTPSRTYTVAPGDSLSAIAVRFGVSTAELAAANGLKDANTIVVGRVLIIPSPAANVGVAASNGQRRTTSRSSTVTTYRVQPGDTLSELAQRFGVTTAALAAVNALTDPNQIVVGRTLRIVGPSSVRAVERVPSGGPRTTGP